MSLAKYPPAVAAANLLRTTTTRVAETVAWDKTKSHFPGLHAFPKADALVQNEREEEIGKPIDDFHQPIDVPISQSSVSKNPYEKPSISWISKSLHLGKLSPDFHLTAKTLIIGALCIIIIASGVLAYLKYSSGPESYFIDVSGYFDVT